MAKTVGTLSGSISILGEVQLTGSLLGTASVAVSSSTAVTASYVDITGSGIIVNYNGTQIQLTGSIEAGGSQVYVSDSAPTSSLATGSLWWDTDNGILSVLYNDGDSAQWVEANFGGTVTTASSAINAVSASFALTASYISGAVVNIGDAYPSSPVCNKIVTLSQAEYDAIGVKDANTFYIITA